MDKWHGFNNRFEMAKEFEEGNGGRWATFEIADNFPTDEQILFAARGYGSYCGDAFVVFERDGKLYEVHASHCSCFGIEGQWNPEETSWEAIAGRGTPTGDWYVDCPTAQAAFHALVAKHRPEGTDPTST